MDKPAPHLMSELAQRSADRYSLYLSALKGAVAGGLQIHGKRAGVRPGLNDDLFALRETHVPAEREHLREDVSRIAFEAHRDASSDLGLSGDALPEDASTLVLDASSELADHLSVQAYRDAQVAEREVRRAALQINMTVRIEGGSLIGAALKLDRRRVSPDFGTLDRAGRKWSSANLVRTMYRHQLLTAYNDVYLWMLAAAGDSQARVVNPDPAHKYQGMVFDIVGPPGAVTYDSIRAEVFHPNSNSTAALL